MVVAWVGPLYWIQWAGGHRRLHPRGRRNGPGGVLRLPDCATCGGTRGLYGECSTLRAGQGFGRKSTPPMVGYQASYHGS